MNFNLALPFYQAALRAPNAPALWADNRELTYQQMLDRVLDLAHWLRQSVPTPRRVGILASRSEDACVAILASAWIGATYVPINLAAPEIVRTEVIRRSRLDAVVADRQGSALLTAEVLSKCPARVIAHTDSISERRTVTDWASLPYAGFATAPVEVDASHPGYILYTSGTTGTPKGVVVPAGALAHMIHTMQDKYPLRAADRVAETSATSFDISVYNMFATWNVGASLHIVPYAQTLAPAKFIIEHELSVWFSVPSVANLMSRAKLLRPGNFPSLRVTLFCGEPLLAEIAVEWQAAAPNSIVTNMYGPTEVTVFCMGQDYTTGCVLTRDTVGIGVPIAGTQAAILSDERVWEKDGEPGELLLAGPQLALGYLDDTERTEEKFIDLDGTRWYRTGDLAMRDATGNFHFLGRVDNQVKIMGFRVELEDIEFHLRKVSGCEAVCAIPWPLRNGTAAGIIAFVEAPVTDAAHMKEALRKYLPNYFVPSQIRSVAKMPANANGKVDRKILLEVLRQESAS